VCPDGFVYNLEVEDTHTYTVGDGYIVHNCHHVAATTFLKTANLFYGARYGLSATAEREDGLESAYYAHTGPIFFTDLTGDLNATTYFVPTTVVLADNAPEMTDRAGEFSCGKLYGFMAEHAERNQLIIKLVVDALSSGRKILVLSHSAQHPEILDKLFKQQHQDSRLTSGAISGMTPGARRTKIIEDSDVTFATFQIAREGLDVAALDTVIFATPFKAWGAFQQGKGRIERAKAGKQAPIVVVLDDVKINPAKAMCRNLRANIRAHGMQYETIRPTP